MFRRSVIRYVGGTPASRLFSTSPRVLTAGDVGSGYSRAGGERAGYAPKLHNRPFEQPRRKAHSKSDRPDSANRDAYTRRERGSENMYIQREERQKLAALLEKLYTEKQSIQDLIEYIEEYNREMGGQGEQPDFGALEEKVDKISRERQQ